METHHHDLMLLLLLLMAIPDNRLGAHCALHGAGVLDPATRLQAVDSGSGEPEQ